MVKNFIINDTVDGTVEIQIDQDFKHDGIFLSIEGVLNLQSNIKGSRLFNNNIKPLVILNDVIQLQKMGKLNTGSISLPFKFNLVPKSGYDLYESYQGVCININYTLKCEIKRGFLLKDFMCIQEIIIQNKAVKTIELKSYRFELNKKSLKNFRNLSELPQFKIYGYFDSIECNIDDPFRGEIIVEKCDVAIKSIVVFLNRIENYDPNGNSFQEETEVQSIQIADGDVLRNVIIPIHLVFPRLLCCPSITTRYFQIEFGINISILLEDGNLISEDFPLKLHRVIK